MMAARIRPAFDKLRARIPEELPRGMDSLNVFMDELLALYGLPATTGYKRMIATMIQHLPQNRGKVSKHQLYQAIKRAEAMETAFWKLRELQEEEKKQAATPNSQESLDGATSTEGPSEALVQHP